MLELMLLRPPRKISMGWLLQEQCLQGAIEEGGKLDSQNMGKFVWKIKCVIMPLALILKLVAILLEVK